jgi:hypothetical protein
MNAELREQMEHWRGMAERLAITGPPAPISEPPPAKPGFLRRLMGQR